MRLPYDPANGPSFWDSIARIPGFPPDEGMPIKHMVFEAGALFRLSAILTAVGARKSNPLVIVMDQTAMRRGGDDLKSLVLTSLKNNGWQIRPVRLQGDASGQVHTDLPHIREVQAGISPGSAVISVGSGVVTDITKHACHLFEQETGEKVPFVVYQTANSVSAYTSNMAPVFVSGVKRTLASRYPDALICDLETLRDAPHPMTAAGVGDMLAVFVSLPDWRLAHCLGMDDSHSGLAGELLGPLDQLLRASAEGLRSGSLEAAGMLARVIALGGLAMSLSRATTPLSGFEHVMSHVIDLQAELNHEPLAPHGSQVALAAVAGAEMYRRFLAQFDPAGVTLAACYPSAAAMQAHVGASFASIDASGKAAAECWADYREKLERWHAHRQEFEAALQEWPRLHRDLQAETRPPERLIEILRALDAPLDWSQLNPAVERGRAAFAFMHAPFLRKRFTLGDLLVFLGWERNRLWDHIRHAYFQ